MAAAAVAAPPAGRPGAFHVAFFSAGAAPSREDVERRVLHILTSFDGIDASKVRAPWPAGGRPAVGSRRARQVKLTAHFHKDLGMDSLDAVDVILAVEDEFGIDIPDDDAERIFTAEDAVKYIMSRTRGQ